MRPGSSNARLQTQTYPEGAGGSQFRDVLINFIGYPSTSADGEGLANHDLRFKRLGGSESSRNKAKGFGLLQQIHRPVEFFFRGNRKLGPYDNLTELISIGGLGRCPLCFHFKIGVLEV